MSSESESQNIVVVGGGGAGVEIAKELAHRLPKTSSFKVILVTSREVYVHLPALLRMLVSAEDKLEETALIPYDSLFPNGVGSVRIGTVTRINSKSSGGEVVLEDGEILPYRYLVVATGSIWDNSLGDLSGSQNDLLQSVRDWRKKYEAASSIAIAGAGSVGLELAGELRDLYPNKPITIVHAALLPLNKTYTNRFRQDVLRRWEKRGVKFILDDRIDSVPEGQYTSVRTKNGKEIQADLVVLTRGGRPNTEMLQSLGDVLDAQKRVRVNSNLQLLDHPDIFAAGDIIAVEEQKQLAKVAAQAGVVVANILSLVDNKEPKKTYTGSFEVILITNGKNFGAGFLGALWRPQFGDTLIPMLKGKTLFVPMQRKAMGLAA